MKIEGTFNDKSVEILKYKVEFNNIKKNIGIILNHSSYHHVILEIKDPKGNLRGVFTFKTNKRTYCIGPTKDETSNLALEGELIDGQWEIIIIKPYKAKGYFSLEIDKDMRIHEGYEIVERELRKKNIEKWYTGETHCHSNYSDGKMNIHEILNAYTKRNLDYLFLTDHNLIWTHLPKNKNILSGCELTLDDDGHMNFLGISDPIDYSQFIKKGMNKIEIIEKIIKYIKSIGGIVTINHPYHEIKFSHDVNLDNVDLLEVINSPYEKDSNNFNLLSIKALDFLWEKGYKIYGVGGSDTHIRNFECGTTIGMPKNHTFSKSNLEKDICESLKKGKNYITVNQNITLEIKDNKGNSIYPGEEIDGELEFDINSNNVIHWEVIKNGKVYFKTIGKRFFKKLKIEKNEFLRIQGFDPLGNICFYMNNIYSGKFQKKPITWKEVIKKIK